MKLNFTDAIKNGRTLILSPGCKTEISGILVDSRVDRETVPDDWNLYEVRHSGSGALSTIEPSVFADFYGTFLTKQEITFTKGLSIGKPFRSVSGRGGYTIIDKGV